LIQNYRRDGKGGFVRNNKKAHPVMLHIGNNRMGI